MSCFVYFYLKSLNIFIVFLTTSISYSYKQVGITHLLSIHIAYTILNQSETNTTISYLSQSETIIRCHIGIRSVQLAFQERNFSLQKSQTIINALWWLYLYYLLDVV